VDGRVNPGHDGVLELRVGVAGSEVDGLVLDCRARRCRARNDGESAREIPACVVPSSVGDIEIAAPDPVVVLQSVGVMAATRFMRVITMDTAAPVIRRAGMPRVVTP
jgi:hypothetical protein